MAGMPEPTRQHANRGGAKGNRTPDLLDANESRYQLRHSPVIPVAQVTSPGPPTGNRSLPRGARQVEVPGERRVLEMFEGGILVIDVQHDRTRPPAPRGHHIEVPVPGVLHPEP